MVTGQADPVHAASLIVARAAGIDAALSPYDAASALMRFNAAAPGETVEVPDIFAEIFVAAERMARASGGAFDPTTGPLTHRYGFGPITGGTGRMQDIILTGSRLRRSAPEVTLDLCGIAKGHALDLMLADLADAGARDVLLELGGEVRAIGRHPSGRDWQVAIEDPLSPGLQARHIVAPGGRALATSGHRAQGLVGATGISHVMDPHSRRPATGYAASVSVLADTGMAADAWATALLAMGPGGPDFARSRGLSALFIPGLSPDAASIMTGSFAEHVLA